mgnify:CR=1 FL=1|tara:strand:- start:588 stop:1223 length:636 start_codon:yes stop_codon:yes gene_type:complete
MYLYSTLLFLFLSINLSSAQSLSKEQRQAELDSQKEDKTEDVVTENELEDLGFRFSKDEIVSQSVIDIKGSKETIYSNIKRSIVERFINPDYVLLVEEENKLLRYQGISKILFSWKTFGTTIYYKIKYTVDIDIKEDRIRVSYTSINVNAQVGSNPSSERSLEFYQKNIWKKDGSVRNMYSNLPYAIEDFMNKEASVIKNSETTNSKNDDW